jgi:competence protein ComGC
MKAKDFDAKFDRGEDVTYELDLTRARRPSSRGGFSLLKIVVVVILVGLLYFIFIPSLPVVRERGRRTSCLNYMCQKGLAINLYQRDHQNADPSCISDLLSYIGDDRNIVIFMCPSRTRMLHGKPPKRFSDLLKAPEYMGYDWLDVTSTIPGQVIEKTRCPVMCDKPGNHGTDGITILYADGHGGWWPGTIEDYAASNSLVITVNTNWAR